MADTSLGKRFEEVFKTNWKKCFPNTFIYRLPDMMGGYAGSAGSNPCDFICFPCNNKLYMIECKEHKGASIPFSAIPQYERLLSFKEINNLIAGAVIWFSEKDTVIFVPIQEMEKMVMNGEKSIGLRLLDKKLYNIVVLKSIKKRVFMETDYTQLLNLII